MNTTPSTNLVDLFRQDSKLPPAAPELGGVVGELYTKVRELVAADARLKRATDLVETIKARRTKLSREILPEMMNSLGQDVVGIPEAGVDVVLERGYHASIPVSWEEDKRQDAFSYLEELDGGSLIKSEVVVSFSKEEHDIALQFHKAVEMWLERKGVRVPVEHSMSVNWQNLTSFVREIAERPVDPYAICQPEPLNLARLGATTFQHCKVVRRKEQKKSTRSGGKRRK